MHAFCKQLFKGQKPLLLRSNQKRKGENKAQEEQEGHGELGEKEKKRKERGRRRGEDGRRRGKGNTAAWKSRSGVPLC